MRRLTNFIAGESVGDLIAAITRTAFRLETRDRYNEDCEQDDYELYLAGRPRQPDQLDWLRPWLGQVMQQTAEGKQISRVRVQAEPPTPYQCWERWVGRWNTAAGEDIRYMPRSRAERIGLPLAHDWWLLDGERVIVMRFAPAGEIASRELITDPGDVAPYLIWRDLAVRNATPAEHITAA